MVLRAPAIKVLFVILAASFLAITGPADAAPRLGQPAPGFRVISTSGQTISFENYRGHVLIVDFFATWCQPCRLSIAHLTEMNRKYGKQGLQILGLSADEESEQSVKAFADEFGISYPLAATAGSAAIDYGVRSVPIMFLIGKSGKIAEIYRGYTSESASSVERAIKRLLAEK